MKHGWTRCLATLVVALAATTRCAAPQGKRVLAIRGADDDNVPVAGGVGGEGRSNLAFRSEADSRKAMLASGVDHFLDHIDAALVTAERQGVAAKSARFLGLVEARS